MSADKVFSLRFFFFYSILNRSTSVKLNYKVYEE